MDEEEQKTNEMGAPGGAEPSALTAVPKPDMNDLESLISALEKVDPTKVVPIGFGHPHAYRGFYEDVAFEVRTNVTVGEMLASATSAVGETYQGWKGGDNTMRLSTPVWLVSEEGCCGESLGTVLLHLMLNQGAAKPPSSEASITSPDLSSRPEGDEW